MRFKFLFIAVISFVYCQTIYSQPFIERNIPVGSHDICYDVLQINQSLYYLGTTSIFHDNLDYRRLVIVKSSMSGQLLWKKVFFDFEIFGKSKFKFDKTDDNKIAITAFVSDLKSDSKTLETGILFSLIDTLGYVHQIKSLAPGGGEAIVSTKTGYTVLGFFGDDGNGDGFSVINTNKFGVITNATDFKVEASKNVYAGAITKTVDDNIAVAGNMFNGNLFLTKINSKGHILWKHQFNNDTIDYSIESICENSDKSLIATGYVRTESGDRPLLVCKFDSLGIPIWNKTYQFSKGKDTGNEITSIDDSTYIITGSVNQFGENENLLLMKINENGDIIFANEYGGESYDEGKSLIKTNTGIITVGLTNSFSNTSDYYYVSTDKFGHSECTYKALTASINSFGVDIVISEMNISATNLQTDNITLKSYQMLDLESYSPTVTSLIQESTNFEINVISNKGEVFITSPITSKTYSYTLYSVLGKRLKEGTLTSNEILKINENGKYVLVVSNGITAETKKLVIQL